MTSIPGYVREDLLEARRRTVVHCRVGAIRAANLESDAPRPMEGFAFALGAAAFMGLVVGVVIGLMVGRAW